MANESVHCIYLDISENFEFLIGGEFLRLRLDEHLQEKSLSSVSIGPYELYMCIYLMM